MARWPKGLTSFIRVAQVLRSAGEIDSFFIILNVVGSIFKAMATSIHLTVLPDTEENVAARILWLYTKSRTMNHQVSGFSIRSESPETISLCSFQSPGWHEKRKGRWTSTLETIQDSIDPKAFMLLQKVVHSDECIRLLCLLSYLCSASIPDLLWTADPRFRDEKLRLQFRTPESRYSLLNVLLESTLIERSPVVAAVMIRPAIQVTVRALIEGLIDDENGFLYSLTSDERDPAYWIKRTMELVNIAYSLRSIECPLVHSALASNVLCCLHFAHRYQILTLDLAALQCLLAHAHSEDGEYEMSCGMFEQALQTEEFIFGINHPNTMATLNNLGVTCGKLQRYDQALKFLRRSLGVAWTAFGDFHITVADVLVNLGLIYCAKGEYDQAIDQYHAALDIKAKCLKSDDPKLTEIYGPLGEAYFRTARFELAIESCQRALADSAQGPERERVRIMETLAQSCSSLCLYDAAMRIYEEVVRIKSTLYPTNHLEMADTIHNMGVTMQEMGNFNEAIEAFERAICAYDIQNSHPYAGLRIANAIKNLGVVYSRQGRDIKAIGLFKSALVIERKLGQSDIGRVNTINNLGVAYMRLGLAAKATSKYKRALRIFKNLAGFGRRVETADLLYNIAYSKSSLGQFQSARRYLRRSISIFVTCLGKRHPKSLRAIEFLRSLKLCDDYGINNLAGVSDEGFMDADHNRRIWY